MFEVTGHLKVFPKKTDQFLSQNFDQQKIVVKTTSLK